MADPAYQRLGLPATVDEPEDDTLALLALREKAHRAATGASRQGTDR